MLTDERVKLDVDLSAEVPCVIEGCSDEVKWWGTMRHLSNGSVCDQGPLCDQHRQLHLQRLGLNAAFAGGSKCFDHARAIEIVWRPL